MIHFVPGCRELIRDNDYLYSSSGFCVIESVCERESVSPASLPQHHTLGYLILIWRDWRVTLHYHFNSPDYHSTHRLSSSFENLITVVQDKNSLARLSQGGCYPDGRGLSSQSSSLFLIPTVKHRHSAAHTFIISVTNPELDGRRNTEPELAPQFDREQCGDGGKMKRRKCRCLFKCDKERQRWK